MTEIAPNRPRSTKEANNQPRPTGDRLLNEHEASAYSGVPVGTLRQWRIRKRGPEYLRIPPGSRNGRVRYRVSILDKFLEACVVRPGGDRPGQRERAHRRVRRGSR